MKIVRTSASLMRKSNDLQMMGCYRLMTRYWNYRRATKMTTMTKARREMQQMISMTLMARNERRKNSTKIGERLGRTIIMPTILKQKLMRWKRKKRH